MPGYRAALLLTVLALFRGCDSKVVVVPVPQDKALPSEGVIYALPNTVMRLQMKLDKTSRSGARYAAYAAIFAPDGEPVCKDADCTEEKKVTYSLQQGTTFATYGEPDPDNVFLVKFVGKGAIDQTLSMTWSEAGLLSAASASVTNRTGDVVLSGLKLVAGLGTKAALGAEKAGAGVKPCDPDPSPTDDWAIPILQNGGSTSAPALIANYCAIKKADRDTLYRDDALLKDAVKAYVDKVQPLVAAREQILRGASQTFEPASLLSHIEAEISHHLTVLYLGTKKTLTWDGALDVRTPKVDLPHTYTVLRVAANDGICLGASEVPPDSKPLPDKFTILKDRACADATPVDLKLDFYPDGRSQLFNRIQDDPKGERSFRYRMPARVKAELSDKGQAYGAGIFSVAQLGKVVSFPASRHSKSLSYDLAFVEATGGLKTFKLGTTGALDTATVDALNSVGGTLLDARSKSADDLNRLTREQQILKLKDDICTIQKKYGLDCTVQP